MPKAVQATLLVLVAQLAVAMNYTGLGFISTCEELLYYATLLGAQ